MKHFNLIFSSIIGLLLIFLTSCTSQQYIEAKGNFHTHTLASFDSNESYKAIIDEALNLKFDFIVITDHNSIDENIKEKCLEEKRLLCIQGLEVTPFIGHIVAVDYGKQININQNNQKLTAEEISKIIQDIHNEGGIAIAPHPLPENGGFTLEEISKYNFDAMECYIPRNKQQFPAIKPCVYSSDAHNAGQLKDAFSLCKVKDVDRDGKIGRNEIKELKDAVKEGRCEKAVSSSSYSKIQ